MMLRYVFLVVLVLLAIVSIGSAFIWDDAGTTDYIIAISAALLANQMPGSTRTLAPTSMRPSPRTYEHIGLACATVSILAHPHRVGDHHEHHGLIHHDPMDHRHARAAGDDLHLRRNHGREGPTAPRYVSSPGELAPRKSGRVSAGSGSRSYAE